jgi:hypothetical protein
VSTHSADSANHPPSANLNRQVAQYSLAAAVAGVSMLALVQPAAGEVVVTKKTIHLPLANGGVIEPIKISMANNGVDNFKFSFYTDQSYRHLEVGGASLGDQLQVGTGPAFDVYFGALPRGAKIGPNIPSSFFNVGGIVEISLGNGPSNRIFFGDWGGSPQNRYLGVRFPINGEVHYGWIRLTVTTNPDPHTPVMSATITGYAYETVANKAIKAGTAAIAVSEVNTPTAEVQVPKNIQNQSGPALGMLAVGADALPLWRREETSVRQ